MRQARRLVLTTATALLAGAAICGSAWGSTAQIIEVTTPPELPGDDPGAASAPALIAKPGEANRVRISPGPNAQNWKTVLIEDLGATLTVGPDVIPGVGCVSLDAHHARCANVASQPVAVYTETLDDRVIASPGVSIDAHGGAGIDQLIGADGSDTLSGGGSAGDVLAGLGGDDVLTDNDGEGGSLLGSPIDADILNGGDGNDTVRYATRTAAVTVDLTKATQAEGDSLPGIENVEGGKGADLITGSVGKNALRGGPGNDVIKAGAGDDDVLGGAGNDKISLGSGNDRVSDKDQKTPTGDDEIDCGKGIDRITATTKDKDIDKLAANCDTFVAAELTADGNFISDDDAISVRLRGVRRSGNRLLVPVKCERPKKQPTCVITGQFRAPHGIVLAPPTERVKVKPGKKGTLRLRLSTAGKKRVHHGQTFRLIIADRTSKKAKSPVDLVQQASAHAHVLIH